MRLLDDKTERLKRKVKEKSDKLTIGLVAANPTSHAAAVPQCARVDVNDEA